MAQEKHVLKVGGPTTIQLNDSAEGSRATMDLEILKQALSDEDAMSSCVKQGTETCSPLCINNGGEVQEQLVAGMKYTFTIQAKEIDTIPEDASHVLCNSSGNAGEDTDTVGYKIVVFTQAWKNLTRVKSMEKIDPIRHRELATDLDESTEKSNVVQEGEPAAIDLWLQQNQDRMNRFGDEKDTMYAGGSPLFNERTGETTSLYAYVKAQHPNAPWQAFLQQSPQLETKSSTGCEMSWTGIFLGTGFLVAVVMVGIRAVRVFRPNEYLPLNEGGSK